MLSRFHDYGTGYFVQTLGVWALTLTLRDSPCKLHGIICDRLLYSVRYSICRKPAHHVLGFVKNQAPWTPLPPNTHLADGPNTSISHTPNAQQHTEKMDSTPKRQKTEVPSLLDTSLGQVLDSALQSDIHSVTQAILRNENAIHELAQDPDLMAALMPFMNEPSPNRPVDKHETVCVLRHEADADCTESVTVCLQDMPVFISQCIKEHLTKVCVPCGDESKVLVDKEVLDLSGDACLRDFIESYAYENKKTRACVLERVYSYALDDGEDEEDDEDEKKIVRLLRRDPSTLNDEEDRALDEAFGECIDEFAENMMAEKDTLWDMLTKAGPVKGWSPPSRFTIRIGMSY